MSTYTLFIKANGKRKWHVILISLFLFPHRENGVPIFSLSDQKDIVLELNVINRGDDAYEAQLIASFPKSLSYSAVRTKSSVSPADRYLLIVCYYY